MNEEDRWIPCSERLPSKDGRYLVQYPLSSGSWINILHYGRPKDTERPVRSKCFYAVDDEYGDVPYDDVIAWMPIPEGVEESRSMSENEQEEIMHALQVIKKECEKNEICNHCAFFTKVEGRQTCGIVANIPHWWSIRTEDDGKAFL